MGTEDRRALPERAEAAGMPTFEALNAGKASLLLDLRRESDRARLRALIAAADVFISNASPIALRRLRLDPVAFAGEFPGLIAVTMPAYGGGGPYGAAVAYGRAIQAMAGLGDLTADCGIPSIPLADPLAGIFAAFAVVYGLARRHRDGSGRVLEVPQRDVMVYALRDAIAARSEGRRSVGETAAVDRASGHARPGPLWSGAISPATVCAAPAPGERGQQVEAAWLRD